MKLELEIRHQQIRLKNNEFLVNKTHNYHELAFDFVTDDWQDKDIYIIITDSNKNHYLYNYDETIHLPYEITKGDRIGISCFGTGENSERVTTNELRILFTESGYTQDFKPINPDYDEDVITKIFELLDSKVNKTDVETILDIDSGNPIANSTVTNALNTKSDIGHTHTASEVSGIDGVAEIEIKKAYNLLSNKIRTYGA